MGDSSLPDQVELIVGLDDLASEPEQPDHASALARAVSKKLGVRTAELPPLTLKKRALDARRGKVHYHLLVALGEEPPGELAAPAPRLCKGQARVVIVGDGPAGLFCAYQLARHGVASIVLDRGKEVQPRRRDLKLLNARGGVNPESNYCFGEGGAGTYSDGKLYTRSHKRGPVRDVMEVLAVHGAPAHILTEARPHIGSNLLPKVIASMREQLKECGVEFRFNTRVDEVVTVGSGADRKVAAVRATHVETGESCDIEAEQVVLATGHSARDIFIMAERMGLTMEAKGFALGVRIEHPQNMINRIQYGKFAEHPSLGAAAYKIATQVEGRGVFSFCMCPGGWIVPAMTDADHLVVNGMSLSKRDSPYANSGFVVGIEPEDYQQAGFKGVLGGVHLQQVVERAAQVAGGGQNRAPACRVSDFVEGKVSQSLPETSYLPGLTGADLGFVLDQSGLNIAERMREAIRYFGRKMRGYDSQEGILVGVETRTSAPVRIVRDTKSMCAPEVAGLYLAGEGPGYAGGIVSAAVDGIQVAHAICAVRGIASIAQA